MFQILRFTERSYKSFNYFGINLKLPNRIKYIATDSDGEVYGYYRTPYNDSNSWGTADEDDVYLFLGTIEFKGDFKHSLVEVKE